MTMLGDEIPRYPLVTARLAATPSVAFYVSNEYPSVTLTAHGLSAGESIPVQTQADSGTWANASSTDPNTLEDIPVELTSTANTLVIDGIGTYRVNKSVTALPTSVTLYR